MPNFANTEQIIEIYSNGLFTEICIKLKDNELKKYYYTVPNILDNP